MNKKPLLFVSDSISASSGLGRITRDLAMMVHKHLGEQFRVGCAGYGGAGSAKYPFPQYHFHSVDNWLLPELPAIVDDFSQGEEPIIMFVWDASRLYWIGIPETCPIPQLRQWVEKHPKKLWLYGAIDSEGPNGKVSSRIAETLKGFDRVIDYSAFSSRITGNPTHLPHGIDTSVFYPRDMRQARSLFIERGFKGLQPNSMLIGIVATNQARKNWQLGMETAKILLDRGHDVRVWAKTDVIDRHWSIGNLITDYGLLGRVAVTTDHFTDDQLAWMYSACHVTLGIGPEGFGYPIAESLACGVPCICGSYGGQAEFVPARMQVNPIAYHHEGGFCSKRPVHDSSEWADKVEQMALERTQTASVSLLPSRVDWNGPTLRKAWLKWFQGDNPVRTLDTIRELNYDHHRRMTEDHIANGSKTSAEIKNRDNESYRALLAGIPKDGKILELGSASGGQWDVLSEWSTDLTGIDLYAPAVNTAQAEGKNIHIAFVEKMPFLNDSFDLVCSRHVMEHVSDIQVALAEIKRVLRPGGIVAAVTPHRFPDLEPAHIQQLRIDEWKMQYAKAGFILISADIREFECVECHIVARKPE